MKEITLTQREQEAINALQDKAANIPLEVEKSLRKKGILKSKSLDVFGPFCIHQRANIEIIEDIVCNYFNVSKKDVYADTRKRDVIYKRQIIHYFARKHTRLTLEEIGIMCGNKNHATVLYGHRVISNERESYKDVNQQIKDIDNEIKNANSAKKQI